MRTLITLAITLVFCQIGATVVVAQNQNAQKQNGSHHRHVAASAKPASKRSATLTRS